MSRNVHANSASDSQNSVVGESEARALSLMNRLYRTALIITGSPRFAKNLLYATCLKARHGHTRFHSDDELGMWMFRILLGAFWLNRPGVDLRQGESFNLTQCGDLFTAFLLARSPKNPPTNYPFRETILPPVCAVVGL